MKRSDVRIKLLSIQKILQIKELIEIISNTNGEFILTIGQNDIYL